MSTASATKTVEPATPPQPRTSRRYRQFGLGTLLLAMIPLGVLFLGVRNYLDNRPIEWVPYSAKSLGRELGEGRIVLVNFRADWALNAIVNERHAIEIAGVKKYLEAHRIVPMKADWTDGSNEIKEALGSIGVNTLPAIAVYSPAYPDTPIVLGGLVTKQQVLDALKMAVVVTPPLPSDKK